MEVTRSAAWPGAGDNSGPFAALPWPQPLDPPGQRRPGECGDRGRAAQQCKRNDYAERPGEMIPALRALLVLPLRFSVLFLAVVPFPGYSRVGLFEGGLFLSARADVRLVHQSFIGVSLFFHGSERFAPGRLAVLTRPTRFDRVHGSCQ
jgi:hypothetical protein